LIKKEDLQAMKKAAQAAGKPTAAKEIARQALALVQA
jgi:UDP-N-acetylglucosamine:LPS N-acetylglucosamine transferase